MTNLMDTTLLSLKSIAKYCSRCKKLLPITNEYFATRKEGFRCQCRQCQRDVRKNPPLKIICAIGFKICTNCRRSLPSNNKYFNKNRNKFSSRCKQCINEYAKKKRPEKALPIKCTPGFKVCAKCNKELLATTEYFHKAPANTDKLKNKCKQCCHEDYREKHPVKQKCKPGYKICTKCNKELQATTQNFTKAKLGKYGFAAYCKQCSKEYTAKNKNKRRVYQKANKQKIFTNMKKRRKSPCSFESSIAQRLSMYEDISKDDLGNLNVKCTYCERIISPTISQVEARLTACEAPYAKGEGRIYCDNSQNGAGCREACPIFYQQMYPKGFKVTSSREVLPEFRKMVLAHDNYTCLRCYKNINEAQLHVHHINGAVQSPMEVADIQNAITVCKACHKIIHKKDGCSTFDYRKKPCKATSIDK